ncbi:MAG: hypothetical protein CL666_16570 [Balneola sp.]|nr:hypothetical protein [Balneola sp.]|tara:strand:+ start:94171 stop:95025 length:855 start_codon:yes stop_codon:yes gene_type:complete
MYKKRIWFYSFLIVMTFSGCDLFNLNNEKKGLNPQELQDQLVDKTWELRTVLEDGYGVYAPGLDSMYTIHFSDDGQFSGHEICNHCGGEYHINDNSNLVIEGMSCTEMACYGFQDVPFTNVLTDQEHPATIRDDKLFISVKNDSMNQTYQFSEYGTIKDVILAKPTSKSEFDFSAWPIGYSHHLETSLSGDSLTIELGYSGCGPHELNLVFYDYFEGSNPTNAHAFVSHREELCDAVFESTETFSLLPLKKAYQDTENPSQSLQLIIGDNDHNSPKPDTLLYTF